MAASKPWSQARGSNDQTTAPTPLLGPLGTKKKGKERRTNLVSALPWQRARGCRASPAPRRAGRPPPLSAFPRPPQIPRRPGAGRRWARAADAAAAAADAAAALPPASERVVGGGNGKGITGVRGARVLTRARGKRTRPTRQTTGKRPSGCLSARPDPVLHSLYRSGSNGAWSHVAA